MYCASLCRSAIHAPRICNSIGQYLGFRRHRIFVPATSPKSCNRCRIAGGTCREYTVQSVPARSRCSGIGSGHTSSISTNPFCPYSMQKAANMFLFFQEHTYSTRKSISVFSLMDTGSTAVRGNSLIAVTIGQGNQLHNLEITFHANAFSNCTSHFPILSSSFHRDLFRRKYRQMPTPKKAITKKKKAAPLPLPAPNKTVSIRLFCAAIIGSQI